jgi:hypothetical protein
MPESRLTFEAGPPTLNPPAEPADAFAAMEAHALLLDASSSLSDPILPCQPPYIELDLVIDDEPAAFANYRLSVPGAEGRSGKLDERGHIRIDGVDVSAGDVMLKVHVEDDDTDPDAEPVFEIQLVPVESAEPVDEDEEEEPELLEYFHPTFDHRLVPFDDEGDENDDAAED